MEIRVRSVLVTSPMLQFTCDSQSIITGTERLNLL
jgi:hypothetical protein